MTKLRTSSLKIGRVVNQILSKILPTYPIVAEKGTQYPFAVYRRTGLQTANTKDIYNTVEYATVEIIVAATTYNESLKYAQDVKVQLENQRGISESAKEEDIKITDVFLTSASEDFVNDAYIQYMTFVIHIEGEHGYR